MKLAGAEAARYCAAPNPAHAGILIFGADAMRVALKRQEAVAAIGGPEAEAEMRLTRLSGADVRRDAAALGDAIRAQSFFPGPRVVHLEEATDGLAEVLGAALADWRPGDAQIVVTAGALPGKAALKALFEGARNAVAIGLYDDPPSREEIAAELTRAGLTALPSETAAELGALAQALEPGDFRQTLEKIALYKWQDPTPLTPDEVLALAPQTVETGIDALIAAVAERRAGAVGLLVRRLEGQGVTPVAMAIAALRHFRMLHVLACDPGGPQAGLGRLRPPPIWKLRDALARQAGAWGRAGCEEALSLLVETDLTLRSASRAPGMALVERALMRLAMRRG